MLVIIILNTLLYIFSVESALKPIKKYIAVNQQKNWYDAQKYCRNNFGKANELELAKIFNSNDNKEALKECRTISGTGACFIGLTDITKENNFKWSPTGESLKYSNWNPGEPNNWSNNEDCVEILTINGKWNDISCNDFKRTFLCENKDFYKKRGYFKGPKKVNYLDAYAYCKSRNSVLAAITNKKDNDEILGLCGKQSCWIGFTDISDENKYIWLDGTKVTYKNWAKGEANNAGYEHCTEFVGFSNNGEWNDNDCLTFKAFPICNHAPSKPIFAKTINNKNTKFFEKNFNNYHNNNNNNNSNNTLIEYSFMTSIISLSLIISVILFMACFGIYFCFKTKNSVTYKTVNVDSMSDTV